MKKFILVLLLVLAIAGYAFADATTTSTITPKAGKIDFGAATGTFDPVQGYGQRVDSNGSAKVMEKSKTITSSTGVTLNTGQIFYTGACRVNSVVVGGVGTSAGDYVLIYDALTATGTPVLEVSVGTAKDTVQVNIPGGADFATGIFVDSNAAAVHCAVAYDY
jgi:hypothetical protein